MPDHSKMNAIIIGWCQCHPTFNKGKSVRIEKIIEREGDPVFICTTCKKPVELVRIKGETDVSQMRKGPDA